MDVKYKCRTRLYISRILVFLKHPIFSVLKFVFYCTWIQHQNFGETHSLPPAAAVAGFAVVRRADVVAEGRFDVDAVVGDGGVVADDRFV